MGNCCGKQDSEAFAQPGRVLGSSSSQDALSQNKPTTAPIPKKVGGPARTLGGGAGASTGGDAAGGQDDARRKAAEAAEARAKSSSKPGGKLQSQLAAQKKQTRSDTLKDVSETERRARDVDDNTQARNWD